MKPASRSICAFASATQRARASSGVVAAGVDVDVRVDHAGHDGRRAQIDHARAGRNRNAGADIGDAIALDQDKLIFQQPAGHGIEQPSGPDGDNLILRRKIFSYTLRRCGRARHSNGCHDKRNEQTFLPTHERLLTYARPLLAAGCAH